MNSDSLSDSPDSSDSNDLLDSSEELDCSDSFSSSDSYLFGCNFYLSIELVLFFDCTCRTTGLLTIILY